MPYNILIVDDDTELQKMLKNYFRLRDYQVDTAIDGVEAVEKAKSNYDVIILDVAMPGMDGIEVCKAIRESVECPIIFLTARSEEQDKINGLLSGGDDYILKPFSILELEARVIAHLKREERHLNRNKVRDGFVIDYVKRAVFVDRQEMELTKIEYGIIEFLSMNPGQVFDKERIYEKVCGYDAEGDSRVITELIYRIRKKMEALSVEEHIVTVWGMGYKWKK
ncbi:response regulator transcription factor [Extibacter muris]|uniref:response regulator transcription factor n=1 Tax=Extibacter muris TaxID=1796622 RepID=UPI001D092DD2|nr:response regulator transcription factor [Extibacter muris]MCB6203129.1 response regulator transcription factor [Extibacter muris]MCQ4664354.1 response regulator transcription factor [Extibacter muris]MCQ4692308.1 response regulator transcription factor [Extibacter muris]MCQ4692447.1 response regulator transcription factor [Extibacter muris]